MRLIASILACVALAGFALALQPDELALIVNKNVPDGRALAETYAKARNLPGGRIIELDLPPGDDISVEQYETGVVPAVREFLASHELAHKVRCLVTFYGIPLRIAQRENTPAEKAEIESLREEIQTTIVQIEKITARLEEQATKLDPGFRPQRGSDASGVLRRLEFTRQYISQHLNRIPDLPQREKFIVGVNQMAEQLMAPATTQPTTREAEQMVAEMGELERHRFDPAARARVREIAKKLTGPLPYVRLIDTQLGYLLPDDSQSAFDNELALLHWPLYSRVRWQLNSLYFRVPERLPTILMVSRLDAQTPDTVRQMIAASIDVEQHGLQGSAVIDLWAKNSKRPNGEDDDYTKYDKSMANLATIIREKTKIPLVLDDRPELIPQSSVKEIALYCGWYSPNEFVSPGTFVRGAVGAHVASFTLTQMHNPSGGDWVRQLLNEGVVATFGAVSEPYLHSFPKPDDLFPLILTGKVPLAEAYWRTNPLTS
ncbi:MAG TPA: TIGR03790 family protein, partial [Tepidisphaeraceae bacterium]|nr:TIGR03790 family protein [Tepidisphaeraceae bacterium]